MDQECQKKQQKVILITEPLPGEGVSVIARNLSYALAELGKRVVLINGDLQGETGASQRIRPGRPAVWNLQSGGRQCRLKRKGTSCTWNARKGMQEKKLLSMGEAVGKVIQPFRKVMDYIIIDAPPCTSLSHTALFAEHADVIAYVVRQNQEAVGRVLEGIEEVSGYGASFGGCILSRCRKADWPVMAMENMENTMEITVTATMATVTVMATMATITVTGGSRAGKNTGVIR